MSDDLLELLFAEAEEKMEKSVVRTKSEFSSIRTGRPSPALVERIQVEYFGSDVPLQQLASFSVPEAQLLVIAPFDKGAIEAIERAIVLADLGVSPANDGSILRLNFPPLTEERRKQLVKVVKNLAEEGEYPFEVSDDQLVKNWILLIKREMFHRTMLREHQKRLML